MVYSRTFAPLRSDRLRRPDDGQEVPACFLESARKLELPVHFCYRPRMEMRLTFSGRLALTRATLACAGTSTVVRQMSLDLVASQSFPRATDCREFA